jgi:hypothetical protein
MNFSVSSVVFLCFLCSPKKLIDVDVNVNNQLSAISLA